MNSTLHKMSLLAVVASMILSLGAGTRNDRVGGLQVQGVTVQSTRVNVVVANTSTTALSGTLTIRPLLILPPISVPVTVPGSRTVTVSVTFPGVLVGGVTCGVVLDDGAPF